MEDRAKRISEQVHGPAPFTANIHCGTLLRVFRMQRALPHRLLDERLETLALVYGEQSPVLLCAGLALQGYPANLEAYREVEAGLRLPDDPVHFFDALSAWLGLSDTEVAMLLWQYAYDLLRAELGDDLTNELFSIGAVVDHCCERFPTDADHEG